MSLWRRWRLRRRQRRAERAAGLVEARFRVLQRGAGLLLAIEAGAEQHLFGLDHNTAYRLARLLLKKSRHAEAAKREK